MTAPKAIVIGGGIGGLAAAVALRKVGMTVTVFERAPEICEVGAGLSLWSNAVTALRRLGLESRITELGSPVERIQVVTASGQVLSEITIEALSRKAGAPSLCVHRADLLRTLAEALELSVIRTNAMCVGFEQHSDVVTARFADGRSNRAIYCSGLMGFSRLFEPNCSARQSRGMPVTPVGAGSPILSIRTCRLVCHCSPWAAEPRWVCPLAVRAESTGL